ncbi:MAG: hypothetical protein AB2705_21565, partial [Candidatus Thiodiazotropha sp.]
TENVPVSALSVVRKDCVQLSTSGYAVVELAIFVAQCCRNYCLPKYNHIENLARSAKYVLQSKQFSTGDLKLVFSLSSGLFPSYAVL